MSNATKDWIGFILFFIVLPLAMMAVANWLGGKPWYAGM